MTNLHWRYSVYAFGGFDGNQSHSSTWGYDGAAWRRLADLPQQLYSIAAVPLQADDALRKAFHFNGSAPLQEDVVLACGGCGPLRPPTRAVALREAVQRLAAGVLRVLGAARRVVGGARPHHRPVELQPGRIPRWAQPGLAAHAGRLFTRRRRRRRRQVLRRGRLLRGPLRQAGGGARLARQRRREVA